MKVIPAIDLIGGRLVRLEKGDYATERGYGLSPLEAAKRFEDGGLSCLHLVDLDAAKGQGSNLGVLEMIAARTSLSIDFGGGIRSVDDAVRAFEAGASAVNIGSWAVREPEDVISLAHRFPSRVILSADCRGGRIAVSGWTENTGLDIMTFLSRYFDAGVNTAAVTDISRDGTLSGPSADLYRRILTEMPALRLIASGGVSCAGDLKELARLGCHGVIVGKAYYEGRVTVADMKEAECSARG